MDAHNSNSNPEQPNRPSSPPPAYDEIDVEEKDIEKEKKIKGTTQPQDGGGEKIEQKTQTEAHEHIKSSDPTTHDDDAKTSPKQKQAPKSKTTNVSSLTDQLMSIDTLDLCFVMDATGSMGSYIAEAQKTVTSIIDAISKEDNTQTEIGLIAYRDHPPQDRTFVTKKFDFTKDPAEAKKNLQTIKANGGGDRPEAVTAALHETTQLSWRDEAVKIAVLIADAPPHGLGTRGDGFPNGCPDGHDPIQLANLMTELGITLYVIGCEPGIADCRDFFMALTEITGGQYVPLGSSTGLSSAILGGAREEISLERIMRSERSIFDSAEMNSADVSDERKDRMLQDYLARNKAKTHHLSGGKERKTFDSSEMGKTMSKCANLAEVRNHYVNHVSAADSSRSRLRRSSRATSSEHVLHRFAPAVSEPIGAYSSYESFESPVSIAQCKRMNVKHKARAKRDARRVATEKTKTT